MQSKYVQIMSKLKYQVISSLDQYNEYCDKHEQLMSDYKESDIHEIELLELLISDYNERTMQDYKIELNPVELLKSILADDQISQIELSKRMGISPQLLNDILHYRRDIIKKLAYKLAKDFSMDITAFVQPYELKKVG